MLLIRLLLSFMIVLHSSSERHILHVYSPGDILIGGLFPFHSNSDKSPNQTAICSDYNFQMFLRSQAMIYAIEEINQRTPRLLPNLTLGYEIYDTCRDVSLAIRETLQLMKNQSDSSSCLLPENVDLLLPEPQTKVVIGERHSEISTAVARILALTSVTQISYASTSELLSEKSKFPTFFRTVPSDAFQTKAIYELVKEFNWKAVAIIGSDDEYGKYGSDGLQLIFTANNICVDFVEILPDQFDQYGSSNGKTLTNLIKKIQSSTAEAIVMFTKDSNVETVLKEVIKNNLNRTWIASDTWSTAPRISMIPGIEKIGQVFGFIFKRNEVPGFRDYVRSMFSRSKNEILDYHLTHYPLCSNESEETIECNCSMTCSDPNCLASFVDQDESYSIYLAVQVIAEGLRNLLKCEDQTCERTRFTAFELLEEIKKVNFTVNTTKLYFKDGDPSLGYDVMYWNYSVSHRGMEIQTIGEYWPDGTITFQNFPKDLLTRMKSVKVTDFNCSKICDPGKMLKIKSGICCHECTQCVDGEVSNGTQCVKCGTSQYSSDERDKCMNKTNVYLNWDDPISITLSFFTVLGILIIIGFFIVLKLNAGTPVVKAVGGRLGFLELLSLLFSFCLIFTFLDKPTETSCAGIPLFGFGFSLCMACILDNMFQITLGFNFKVRGRSWIWKHNRSIAVVITVAGIQLAVSILWLILIPPKLTIEDKKEIILYQCSIDDHKFFIVTITYNAFLGIICFLFAFKTRELPDLYRNASLIAVSMVLFLIVWIIFVPLFLTLEGKYRPATNCAAILISGYSILGCHIAPKCYIVLFRKELNNENAISEYIRKHFEQKGLAVIK